MGAVGQKPHQTFLPQISLKLNYDCQEAKNQNEVWQGEKL